MPITSFTINFRTRYYLKHSDGKEITAWLHNCYSRCISALTASAVRFCLSLHLYTNMKKRVREDHLLASLKCTQICPLAVLFTIYLLLRPFRGHSWTTQLHKCWLWSSHTVLRVSFQTLNIRRWKIVLLSWCMERIFRYVPYWRKLAPHDAEDNSSLWKLAFFAASLQTFPHPNFSLNNGIHEQTRA